MIKKLPIKYSKNKEKADLTEKVITLAQCIRPYICTLVTEDKDRVIKTF